MPEVRSVLEKIPGKPPKITSKFAQTNYAANFKIKAICWRLSQMTMHCRIPPSYQDLLKVFEQTYTRFLDLQKAEAQKGGSSSIRTSSRHADTELKRVIDVIFAAGAKYAISIFFEGEKDWLMWAMAMHRNAIDRLEPSGKAKGFILRSIKVQVSSSTQ